MLLTFLWRDPNAYFRIIAVTGSVSLLVALASLLSVLPHIHQATGKINPMVRNVAYLAIFAFVVKTFLQSFTIFPAVGTAVFGDRPVIIGFLHMVFLGFVSLMLLAYFTYTGLLNSRLSITKTALAVFTTAIILNEVVLMSQGIGAMFIKSSQVFPWLLWGISMLLLTGALLLGAARIKTNSMSR